MQDRVSLYPGRVKLVPVSGQENTYDMVRADSPTQEGTPLNKDSLLKDATAALFGLGTDAVPDDALVALKNMLDGISAQSLGACQIATGSYTGTGYTSKTFNLGFDAKLLCIYDENRLNHDYKILCIKGFRMALFQRITGGTSYDAPYINLSEVFDGYTVTMSGSEFNKSGEPYKYWAIG